MREINKLLQSSSFTSSIIKSNPAILDTLAKALPKEIMDNLEYIGSGSNADGFLIDSSRTERFVIKVMQMDSFLESAPWLTLSGHLLPPAHVTLVTPDGVVNNFKDVAEANQNNTGIALVISPAVLTDTAIPSDPRYGSNMPKVKKALDSVGLRHHDWNIELGYPPSQPDFPLIYDWTSVSVKDFDAWLGWKGDRDVQMAIPIPNLQNGEVEYRYHLSNNFDIETALANGVLKFPPKFSNLEEGISVSAGDFDEEKARELGIKVADKALVAVSKDDLLRTRKLHESISPIYSLPQEERMNYITTTLIPDSSQEKTQQRYSGGGGPERVDPMNPQHHQPKSLSPEEAAFNFNAPPKLRTFQPGVSKKGGRDDL